jgi:hypothetical protein
MAEKSQKIETEGNLDIKEPAENPLEERVANLETMMQQSIAITNNLITYCNTLEKWRKMDFVPPKSEEEGKSEDGKAEDKPEESKEPAATE